MKIEIVPFQPDKEQLKGFKVLFDNKLFNPFANYRKINPSRYADLCAYEITRAYKSRGQGDLLFSARIGNKIAGIIVCESAEWDSGYFGVPMAKIIFLNSAGSLQQRLLVNTRLLDFVHGESIERGVRHLTIRVGLMDDCGITALGRAGYKIAALEGLNFTDKIENTDIENKGLNLKIEKLQKKYIPEIIRIAQEISVTLKSRYHFDNNLPREKVLNYYVENVKNCCGGSNADEVIIAKYNGEVAGFFAWKSYPSLTWMLRKKSVFAVLFAVSSYGRKQGISEMFMYKASRYLLNKNALIAGRVYLHNIPMIRLLAKFNPCPFSGYLYCMHKWLDNKNDKL